MARYYRLIATCISLRSRNNHKTHPSYAIILLTWETLLLLNKGNTYRRNIKLHNEKLVQERSRYQKSWLFSMYVGQLKSKQS